MSNRAGILGSAFQHWGRSRWRTVEGMENSLSEQTSVSWILAGLGWCFCFSLFWCRSVSSGGGGGRRSCIWSESEGVWRSNSTLCIHQPQVCALGALWSQHLVFCSPPVADFIVSISLCHCSYNCSQSEPEEKLEPLCTDIETKVILLSFFLLGGILQYIQGVPNNLTSFLKQLS